MTFSYLFNQLSRCAPVILFASLFTSLFASRLQASIQTDVQALRTTSGYSAQIADLHASTDLRKGLKLGLRAHETLGELFDEPFRMHRAGLFFVQSLQPAFRVEGDFGFVSRDFENVQTGQSGEGYLNFVYDMGPWSSIQLKLGREILADALQENGPMRAFLSGHFAGIQAGRVHGNRFRWQVGHRQTELQDGNKLTNNDVSMYLGEAKAHGSIWVGLGFEQSLNSQPTDLYFSPRSQVKMGPRIEFVHDLTERWQTSWNLKWSRVEVDQTRLEANFFGVSRFTYKASTNWASYVEAEYNHSDNPSDQWSSETVRVGLDIPL